MKYPTLIIIAFLMGMYSSAQDVNTLIKLVKNKLDNINRYQATGTMKTSIAYLKIPIAKVNIQYRKPNELTIKSNNGVTFVPKGVDAISLQNIFSSEFTAIDGGTEKIKQKVLRVVRLLPTSQQSNIVLSTVYINPSDLVVEKSSTTTKDEGTYEMEMQYGKYIQLGLPDKVTFTFNAKDYKIPKGLTLDFDNASSKNQKIDKTMLNKGKAEIVFQQYTIN
ncbi:MAG: hypothetical protein RLY46_1338 [Bacteroidota bacterium]|jgi:hypothetical protein